MSDVCNNFWREEGLTATPWAKGCKIYQHTNPCNKYEISFDGKSIESCDMPYECPDNKTSVTPKCLEEYANKDKYDPEAETIFPDTG